MEYYCNICNKQYSTNKILKKHFQTEGHKRRSCPQQTIYKCACLQSFTKLPALYRHRKKCNVYLRPARTNDTQQVIGLIHENQQMKTEIQHLRKYIETLIHNPHNIQNQHNNIQTQNNIETQNVIVVNSFGQENTEYLTDQIVSKLIQNGPFTCLPKIIERIHFDPDHPENHNIKVTNKKLNYAEIVKDNKWVTTNKKHAIEAMIQNGYDLLDEKYQDNKESISDFKQERFEDFQQKFQEEDKELVRTIKDEVDIALLNGTGYIHK